MQPHAPFFFADAQLVPHCAYTGIHIDQHMPPLIATYLVVDLWHSLPHVLERSRGHPAELCSLCSRTYPFCEFLVRYFLNLF